jgi:ankyrin repeat protein
MAAAAGFQTATAAISIVQLAYQTYQFVVEVAQAHQEAKTLSQKTNRLTDLVKTVCSRLDLRRTAPGPRLPSEEEKVIEETVDASLQACQECLLNLNRILRGLSPNEPLDVGSRFVRSVRFTLSASERQKQERVLETRIQELSMSLHLLQLLEHADTHNQLAELRRQVSQALAHLRSLLQQTSPDRSSVIIESQEQMEIPPDHPDYLGVQSLKRTIQVAQSVCGSYGSAFNPDSQSAVRMEEEFGSEYNDMVDVGAQDSTAVVLPEMLPRYDAAIEPEQAPSEVDSYSGFRIAEPMDDPIRTDSDPPELLSRWKSAQRMKAEEQIAKQNYPEAEKALKRAFKYGMELEQANCGFADRTEMRQLLIDIYVKQNRFAEAARELGSLVRERTNEDTTEQKLEIAMLWTSFARVHHCMFRSNRDRRNLEAADGHIRTAKRYAFGSAFGRLLALRKGGHIDEQRAEWRECVNLMAQILEDRDAVLEAEECRALYLGSETPSTLLQSPQDAENADGGQAEIKARLETPGRPNITNAIVFNMPEEFQTILDNIVKNRGDVDKRCDKRWTPIMYAVSCSHKNGCGCEKAIDKLVHHNADINATVPGDESRDETALHQAAARGNEQMVQLLISKGANKNSCAPYTPLVVAVQKNEVTVADILLDQGADAMVRNRDGWNLLHHAVAGNSFDALHRLLQDKHKEKSKDLIESTCTSGLTPLLLASQRVTRPGSYASAEELLRHGANPNAMDKSDRTALYYATSSRACTRERENLAILLMDNHADPMKTPEKHCSNFSFYPSVRMMMKERQALEAVRIRNGRESTELSRRDSLLSVDSSKTSASKRSFVTLFWSKSGSKKDKA